MHGILLKFLPLLLNKQEQCTTYDLQYIVVLLLLHSDQQAQGIKEVFMGNWNGEKFVGVA